MKLSEALEKVNAIYVPGCVAYYEAHKPDPWQAAHDELESIDFKNEEAVSQAAERFVSRCQKLITRYVEDREAPPTKISIIDAFSLGSEKNLEAKTSVVEKKCWACGEQRNIKPEVYDKANLATRLSCPKHRMPI